MQVATLFRETSSLLSGSMDGSTGSDSNNCSSIANKQAESNIIEDIYENSSCGGANDLEIEHFENNLLMREASAIMEDQHQHLHHQRMEHLHQQQQQQLIHQQHQQQQQQQQHQQHNLQKYSNSHSMKLDLYGDPYNFEDEILNANSHQPKNEPKKRGRKKKVFQNPSDEEESKMSTGDSLDSVSKERKKHDRFNGLTEEEVMKRTLPDHLRPNLDMVFIGINPGLFAAFKGHYYFGSGNHFWKCLYLSGLIPEPLTAEEDYNLVRYGIGFTNIVSRPTKGSADLTRKEIKNGCQILLEKIQNFQPKVAVFNGKLIYEIFSGKKDFPFGRQSDFIEGTNTYIWVMPSSSARCAQLPRVDDKVPFYIALKKFRDCLNGLIPELPESEFVFAEPKQMSPNKEKNGNEDSTNQQEFNPFKKKRGRPRKGMEKSKNISLDGQDTGRNSNFTDDENNSSQLAPGKKKRGRPKKDKSDPANSPAKRIIRSSASPDIIDGCPRSGSLSQCHAQTNSSVSSGYSSGTSGSLEDRRREDISSISNAGSGGPSPSHHSFTTQSDLSSEISAAISCGSPPPSPQQQQQLNQNHVHNNVHKTTESNNTTIHNNTTNNNNVGNIFDGLSSMPPSGSTRDLNDPQTNHNISGNPHFSSSTPHDLMENPSAYNYHHHSYDRLLHNLNNRSQHAQQQQQQNNSYQQSMSPRIEDVDNGEGLISSGGRSNSTTYHNNNVAYNSPNPHPPTIQNNKAIEMGSIGHLDTDPSAYSSLSLTKSKSISGLESLVDQIPSIADSDMSMGISSSTSAALDNSHLNHAAMAASLGHMAQHQHHQQHHQQHHPSYPDSSFSPYTSTAYSGSHNSTHSYPHYYPSSELSHQAFPGPNYPPPSLLGYPHPGYPQYPSASVGNPASGYHSSINYNSAPCYTSTYPTGPNPYSTGGGPPGSQSPRNFPQRLNLRQDGGMDLGHLGFGSF